MLGLKRPRSDDCEESFGSIDAIGVRRKLVATSDNLSLIRTPPSSSSNSSSSNELFYPDDFSRTLALSLISDLSTPSSGEILDTPSPARDVNLASTPPIVFSGPVEDQEICFGMLVDGQLSCWKRGNIPTSTSTILVPRFRTDAITILNSNLQEIGVLDKKTADGILSLKRIVPSIRFEINTLPGSQKAPKGASCVSLEVLIYGQKGDLDAVGSVLSQSGLFLQEPLDHRLSVPYRNPHVFSWDDDTDSSYLLSQAPASQVDFTEEIDGILDDLVIPQLSFQVEQDVRIRTKLQLHQLIALKFMVAREEGLDGDRISLWKPIYRHGNVIFKHQITHATLSTRPAECCGGILADKMGMGKSLSVLALVLHSSRLPRNQSKHPQTQSLMNTCCSAATLIIAPKSTIYNWKEQIQKHIQPGSLKVHIYHGQGCNISQERLGEFDVVLTTYETAASDISKSNVLSRIFWLRVVLDEAHQIRNRSTRNFKEITKLRAERRWCLTGTPVQNKLSDLFSLAQFLKFYPFETHSNARKYVLEPLSGNDGQGLENLRLMLQSISLRRTKHANTNTRKEERVEYVTLNQRERQIYLAARNEARKMLVLTTGKSQGHILLRAISACRQVCSHGDPVANSPPTPSEIDSCDKCGDPLSGHGCPQPSFHGTCGHHICSECISEQTGAENIGLDRTPKSCWVCQEPILPASSFGGGTEPSSMMEWESTTPPVTKNSSKIDKVLWNLHNLELSFSFEKEPIKSLVFSHWTRTLDCLGVALSRKGMNYARIDGSLTAEKRRAVIAEFRKLPDIRIMLLSYGSGSVGLNLEAAAHVHLMEPHWNPMVEAQAAARVDRLDQTKDIVIYRYIVKESIEENIQKSQRRKLQDAELSHSSMATGDDLDEDDSVLGLGNLL